jgi:hypothetical protein
MIRNVSRQLQEDRGVTIRQPSTAFFGVSSADRYRTITERRTRPTYPFSFNISRGESLLNGFFTRLALTEFQINWGLPNISSAWGNNTIIFKQPAPAVPFLITLPDQFYTPQDVADVIQNIIQFAFPAIAFLAQCDKATGIINFSANVNISFSPVNLNAVYKELFDMLNFSYNAVAQGTTPALGVNTGIPVLRFTEYIDVVCEQLTAVQDVKDTSTSKTPRDILARIYLDEATPSDATYQNLVATEIRDNAFAITGYNTNAIGSGAKNNGVRPFIIYRQFATPKQIKWEQALPLGNVIFEIYDDQGRSIQRLLNTAGGIPLQYALTCDWNASLLISEN